MLTLIILDLIWALSALVYDWHSISILPIWAIPFILICPLYPLLLALVWLQIRTQKPLNPLLYNLAVLPSAVYGCLALAFYPLIIFYQGFDIYALLQIPWVLFYALQAWYLLFKRPLYHSSLFLFLILLIFSLVFQVQTQSYGYIGLEQLPFSAQQALLGYGIGATILVWLFLKQRSQALSIT